MKPRRRDVLVLIRSAPGRMELRRRYTVRLWPIVARIAGVYRRTLGRRIRIVAIVGSVGKTTTMRTVSAALCLPVSRPALLNANSHAAVGRALMSVPPWRRAVMEVGINGPGQMAIQASTLRPNVVVVTGISRDHWQSFETMAATRDEKAEMVRGLRPRDVAVLNADDANVRWMATQTRARVMLVGEAEDAEIRATDVRLDWPHGMCFTAEIAGNAWPVAVRLIGRHMIFPALAALAVAHLERRPIDEAVAALAALEPTPGRMQLMALPSGAVVIRDEFKGTVDAWSAAAETLAEIPARRRLVVFGEISETRGNQDYRDAGGTVAAVADQVVFVGTRRSFQPFRAGAVAGGLTPDRIEHRRQAHEVVDLLRDDLSAGDVVLIRGRWQQALGRVGLALAGRDVQCRVDPCPFKRMLCDVCPFLEQPFTGLPGRAKEPTAARSA